MMDKLELDARVARLERRVSSLSVALALSVATFSVCALLTLFIDNPHRPSGLPPQLPVAMPRSSLPPPIGSLAWSKSGMDFLDAEVRNAHDLQANSSISEDDFMAIKRSLIVGLSRVDEVARDVQLARKLLVEKRITSAEYDDLRKKILEIDR